jgi:hypothetical protein
VYSVGGGSRGFAALPGLCGMVVEESLKIVAGRLLTRSSRVMSTPQDCDRTRPGADRSAIRSQTTREAIALEHPEPELAQGDQRDITFRGIRVPARRSDPPSSLAGTTRAGCPLRLLRTGSRRAVVSGVSSLMGESLGRGSPVPFAF